MQKRNLGIIAAVTGVLFLGSLGTANAVSQSSTASLPSNSVGTSQVKDNSLTGTDFKNGTIAGLDITDGSVTTKDLSPYVNEKLNAVATDGVDGEDGADGVVVPVYKVTDSATVTKIGGSFKTNATLAGTVDLPAGKYVLTANGFFRSNSVTSGETTLQTAVRVGWGTGEFGTDLGTAFSGGSPSAANREVSTSSTRVVTLTEATTVQLLVFGYDNAGGSADSGKFDAQVFLTAMPVQ